ncbi:type I methionyl aminopeptidase [Candidatus Sumerlaeota bacterium]|nr:type I methionyl aminopeptidase [Candidatus Sumerlaeota bacterium]
MIQVQPGRHAGLIKSDEEIEQMRVAGHELARVRERLSEMVHPGVSTWDLDRVARESIERIGAVPAFLGYHGYPATICSSINEEVVHGIPSKNRILADGDLISIDVGLVLGGFFSDTALTLPVGRVAPEVEHLIAVTRRALDVGIEAARAGRRLGDVSSAIQEYVEGENLSVVREYTGHGIGRQMHEEPKIPNFGEAGKGLRLRPGMVLALEPMVNLGVWNTEVMPDGWTVVTADRKPSAHFEHTISLTRDGVEILTE